jgi:hypothetical protein
MSLCGDWLILKEGLNLTGSVWCAHKARGGNRSVGALIVKAVGVWLPASRITAQIPLVI